MPIQRRASAGSVHVWLGLVALGQNFLQLEDSVGLGWVQRHCDGLGDLGTTVCFYFK